MSGRTGDAAAHGHAPSWVSSRKSARTVDGIGRRRNRAAGSRGSAPMSPWCPGQPDRAARTVSRATSSAGNRMTAVSSRLRQIPACRRSGASRRGDGWWWTVTVSHIEHDLREFGTWLGQAHPDVDSCADLQRRHIEDYKSWVGAKHGRYTG